MNSKYSRDLLIAFQNADPYISPNAAHHIESYNDFITRVLPLIIKAGSCEIVEQSGVNRHRATLTFTEVYVSMPHSSINATVPIYPNECRLYNTNYASNVHADYTFKVETATGTAEYKIIHESSKRIHLGQILTMVGGINCNITKMSQGERQRICENPLENGGYFISGGKEYVIIMQENKIMNNIYKNIDEDKNYKGNSYYVWLQSAFPKSFDMPIYLNVKMSRSNLSKSKDKASKIHSGEIIYCSISSSKTQGYYFPVNILYRALGIATDLDIINLVSPEHNNEVIDKLIKTLQFREDEFMGKLYVSKRDALLFINKKIRFDFRSGSNKFQKHDKNQENNIVSSTETELIEKQLLPHLGGSEALMLKINMLTTMVRKAINLSLGIETPNNIADYGNKRILTSGALYGTLIATIFIRGVMDDFKKKIAMELKNFNEKADFGNYVQRFIDSSKLITTANHINTGIFPAGSAKGFKTKEGITTLLERKGLVDTIDNLSRINAPTGSKNIKTVNMGLREVSAYQYGFIDPYNSSEGEKIGLVKHKTYLSKITVHMAIEPIVKFLTDYADCKETLKVSYEQKIAMASIYINGIPLFLIAEDKMAKLVRKLIVAKRLGNIHRYTSIVPNYYVSPFELVIYTDAHRMIRPLFIVDKDNKLRATEQHMIDLARGRLTWNDFLTGRSEFPPLIEYLEVAEFSKRVVVAMDKNHLESAKGVIFNYCEIYKGSIFSLNTLSMPFPNHSQGPRITFQDNMTKVTTGTPVPNHEFRYDTSLLSMVYPQRANVIPIGAYGSGFYDYPATTNLTIAVIAGTGYDMEDSVVMGKHAADNGFGLTINRKVKTDILDSALKKYMKPKAGNTKGYHHELNYDNIDKDGMPIIGRVFNDKTILIGKVKFLTKIEQEKSKQYEYLDASIRYNEPMPGIVEKCIILDTSTNSRTIKVVLRLIKPIGLADKFAPRVAQKGVLGQLYELKDAPFLEDGSVPTVMFNSTATIKRMTINQFLEMIMAPIAANKGIYLDGSAFNDVSIQNDILPELEKIGIKEQGQRTMFDPKTGMPMKVKIFVGRIAYQRLKHIGSDKLYARGNSGSNDIKNKQPSKGRANNGGSKTGYMELDVLVARGCSNWANDLYSIQSDGRTFFVSNRTGLICAGNEKNGYFSDSNKKTITGVKKIRSTWSTSMMYNYLLIAGIASRLRI